MPAIRRQEPVKPTKTEPGSLEVLYVSSNGRMLPERPSSGKPPNKKRVAWATLFIELVGTIGFEPTTPTMSRWCSNQLSYVPSMGGHSTEALKRVNTFFANCLNK